MHNFDYNTPKGRVERWQVIVQNELAETGDRATTCCCGRGARLTQLETERLIRSRTSRKADKKKAGMCPACSTSACSKSSATGGRNIGESQDEARISSAPFTLCYQ
jgi:hypothetical protein